MPFRIYALTLALASVLAAAPVALAQSAQSGSVSMVEGSLTDITSWGFATNVQVGQTVAWSNVGAQPHTATAVDGTWNTGIVAPGESASLTFDTPGTFAFLCALHPTMKGFLMVTADMPASTRPISMVEPNAADIATWGFASTLLAGESVMWMNMGAQPHSATAPEFSFDTGILNPSEMAALSFESPGAYAYSCSPHPWMKGVVLVTAESG